MEALRILIVEDDPQIGPLLSEVLDELGHVVCAIEVSEAGAVAAAGRFRPDLIIMDVELGSGSGVLAMREILRAGPVPHVFICGAGLLERAPAAIVLQKPFSEAVLVCAMQRALGASTVRPGPCGDGSPATAGFRSPASWPIAGEARRGET